MEVNPTASYRGIVIFFRAPLALEHVMWLLASAYRPLSTSITRVQVRNHGTNSFPGIEARSLEHDTFLPPCSNGKTVLRRRRAIDRSDVWCSRVPRLRKSVLRNDNAVYTSFTIKTIASKILWTTVLLKPRLHVATERYSTFTTFTKFKYKHSFIVYSLIAPKIEGQTCPNVLINRLCCPR